MGKAHSTYGRYGRWGDLRGIDHSEDLSVDRRIILRWIFKK
jgi:hypothetical protein